MEEDNKKRRRWGTRGGDDGGQDGENGSGGRAEYFSHIEAGCTAVKFQMTILV